MSPAENKRAKKRKNKKGRTGLSNLTPFQASNETSVMDKKVSSNQEILPSSVEKQICIKCHRPQTNADLRKTSSKLGEFSAGLLEGFRVSRDLHLCEEKKIELGIIDPLWLCEDCENSLILSESKVMYNSFQRHEHGQSNSVLHVDTNILHDDMDEPDPLDSSLEASNDISDHIASLTGTPIGSLSVQSNGSTCICAACCGKNHLDNEDEEDEECLELKRGWMDVKSYLHKVYREEGLFLSEPHTNPASGATVGESSLVDYLTQSLSKKKRSSHSPSVEILKEWVHKLCKQDPQHLFLCLESQVKLFISEMRIRLLSLLKHLPIPLNKVFPSEISDVDGTIENGHEKDSDIGGISNLDMALKACIQSKFPNNYDGDIFLLWVFHEYQTLCTASRRVAPILEELEATHLKNFNLTWELVNRHLFRSIVYSDPVLMLHIQRCCLNCSCALHLNIEQRFNQKTSPNTWASQSRSSKCGQRSQPCSPSNGTSGSHGGVECPTLVRFSKLDDEMTVINVVYRDAMVLIEEFNKRQMVQAKQRFKDWESFHAQWKMMEQEVLNKKNAFAKAFYQKSLLQCQNTHSFKTNADIDPTVNLSGVAEPIISSSSNNLNLPNSGGKNCKNREILNLNDEALIKLAMSTNPLEVLSRSNSNCSSSPSSSCSSSSESSSTSSVLSPGAVVEIQQGEDLKLLLQEITKLNSNEILPKQVTDLLINSAGLVSQSSSSSISISVPSNTADKTSAFSSNIKCEDGTSTGCLHKHRGDISPSFFSSQQKNPRSDINSFRRNEYLNLYNPVRIKPTLPIHNRPGGLLDKNKEPSPDLNSSCECHDCLTQKNTTLNLHVLPMTENSSSSTTTLSNSASPVGSFPLLPHHLSDIARSAASHLASKALIHPHLYNLHARKTSKTSSILETSKKPSVDPCQVLIPGVPSQATGTNSIDFELVAKEVFREQVKLAAQGEWSLDIVKNKVAEAVMGNLGISNAQSSNMTNTVPLGPLIGPSTAGCPQSKNYFAPIHRNGKGSATPRSRSGSSGDVASTCNIPSPTTSVGTQSDALPPSGSPLKMTQGTSCVIGSPASGNIPSESKNRNMGVCTTETSKLNTTSSKSVSQTSVESTPKGISTSTNTVIQRDQIVMTESTASVAVGTTPSTECQMSGRHHHHHHHHSRDQCCDSVVPSGGGNFNEGDESGLDDSCSERSSSTSTSNPRESRVCDCCYCEVFGHGVPVVAPVSRNYPEMRERLRLRLSKRKAEGSAATSKTTQHLSISSSVAAGNLPENLPITDKSSGKLTSSADDRELDALLRYINGTDLERDGEATQLSEDLQHGCSGNCRKPVNQPRVSAKATSKKQRKKAKKGSLDDKNVEKKSSVSPPTRENGTESFHRELKKVRSTSPSENSINDTSHYLHNAICPKIVPKINGGNSKSSRSLTNGQEAASLKALTARVISNDENLSNSKTESKLLTQSRLKTPVTNPSINNLVLKDDSLCTNTASVVKDTIVRKEQVVVTGPKKNSARVNGTVPLSVINCPVKSESYTNQNNVPAVPIRSKKNKKKKNSVEDSSSLDEVFLPKDIDLENGELDEAEKELEAFKRFCMASVPLANKEKVHVNLKDIVIKKKVNNPNGNMSMAP